MMEELSVLKAISSLTDALAEGKSLKHLLDIGYQFMGNPLAISNSKYELIESSGHKPYNEPLWDEITVKGYVPLNLRKSLRVIKNAHTMDSGISVIHKTKGMSHRIMTVKLPVPNGYYMLFSLESERAFSPFDNEILSSIGAAVSENFKNLAESRDNDAFFLRSLLKSESFDEHALQERALTLGFPLNSPFLLINMHGSFGLGGFAGPLKLRESVEAMFGFSRTLLMEDRLLLLTNTQAGETDTGTAAALDALRNYLRTYQMHGCISRPFKDLMSFSSHVAETSQVLCAMIRISAPDPLFFASNHHILGLLSNLSRKELAALCWPPILELLEIDRTKKTCLLDSLYAYFLCFGSIGRASRLKGVHYSTIKKDLCAASATLGEGWKQLGAQIVISIQCLMLLTPELMGGCIQLERDYHKKELVL